MGFDGKSQKSRPDPKTSLKQDHAGKEGMLIK